MQVCLFERCRYLAGDLKLCGLAGIRTRLPPKKDEPDEVGGLLWKTGWAAGRR